MKQRLNYGKKTGLSGIDNILNGTIEERDAAPFYRNGPLTNPIVLPSTQPQQVFSPDMSHFNDIGGFQGVAGGSIQPPPPPMLLNTQEIMNQLSALTSTRADISRQASQLLRRSQNKKSFGEVRNLQISEQGRRSGHEILKVMQNNRNRRFFGVSVHKSAKMQRKMIENEQMLSFWQQVLQNQTNQTSS